MTETKTKEFMAEMKVLCRVHHSNLVRPLVFILKILAIYVLYVFNARGWQLLEMGGLG